MTALLLLLLLPMVVELLLPPAADTSSFCFDRPASTTYLEVWRSGGKTTGQVKKDTVKGSAGQPACPPTGQFHEAEEASAHEAEGTLVYLW